MRRQLIAAASPNPRQVEQMRIIPMKYYLILRIVIVFGYYIAKALGYI
jgi:hypothetical protein